MNPVLYFLIVLGAIWFLLSLVFYPFDRFLYKMWKDAYDEMTGEEKEKEKKGE